MRREFSKQFKREQQRTPTSVISPSYTMCPAPPSATDSEASLPAMKPKRRRKLFHQPSNDPWFAG